MTLKTLEAIPCSARRHIRELAPVCVAGTGCSRFRPLHGRQRCGTVHGGIVKRWPAPTSTCGH